MVGHHLRSSRNPNKQITHQCTTRLGVRSVKFSVPTVEIRSTVTASDFLAFFAEHSLALLNMFSGTVNNTTSRTLTSKEKHLPGIDYILTRHRERKLVRDVTVHLTEIRYQTITPNGIPTHLRPNLTPSQHMLLLLISHIQRIALAIEETTVTQQVSHRPIKCQSRSWSQTGTKDNGSHHGDNPLLKPTGIQIATKSFSGPTNRKYRKFIYTSRRCFWARTAASTVWSAASISESELQPIEKTAWCAAHPPKSSKVIQKVFLAISIGGLHEDNIVMPHFTSNGTDQR